MCLIAIAYQLYPGCPLAVGANREEFFDRPGTVPAVAPAIPGGIPAMFGRDTRAGGTWLGVSARGLLVAVTNFWFVEPPPTPRSRGALALDLLNCASATDAAELARRELGSGRYAGVNYVCADAEQGFLVSSGRELVIQPLEPGLHVVTNGPPDDPADVRQQYFRQLFAGRRPDNAIAFARTMVEILGQGTGTYGEPTVILRASDRGTVSSSIILLPGERPSSLWWHAAGPPDRTEYADYSPVLRKMLADHAAAR